MTTDLARAVHDERHRRLLAEADARRLRRQLRPPKRARRGGSPGGWILERLRRRPAHPDVKIDRLCDSWLSPDRRAATRLAQVADVIDMPPGTVLAPGRFAYIGLDENHAGLVVSDGAPPVTLTSSAALLVLHAGTFEQLHRSIPMLSDAWLRTTAPANHDTRSTDRDGDVTLLGDAQVTNRPHESDAFVERLGQVDTSGRCPTSMYPCVRGHPSGPSGRVQMDTIGARARG